MNEILLADLISAEIKKALNQIRTLFCRTSLASARLEMISMLAMVVDGGRGGSDGGCAT